MTALAHQEASARPQGRLVVVGIADSKLSDDGEETLITYALGSCLGITVWDPQVAVGAMLHLMLPDSKVAPEKAANNPHMFVDTGVPLLFKAVYARGGVKQRLVVKVAGGASLNQENDLFQIGQRNFTALRKLFWKNSVLIRAHEVGGTVARTMSLSVSTGEVRIRTDAGTHLL